MASSTASDLSQLVQLAKSFIRGLTDSIRGTFDLFFVDHSLTYSNWLLSLWTPTSVKVDDKKPPKSSQLFASNLSKDDSLARMRAMEKMHQKSMNSNNQFMLSGSSIVQSSAIAPLFGQQNDSSAAVRRAAGSDVLEQTFKCCLLNGCLFWTSIVVFDYIILPGIGYTLLAVFSSIDGGVDEGRWLWHNHLSPVLNAMFASLWVIPVFCVSKIVNAIWFQDIADSVFKSSRGRHRMLPSLSIMIADTVMSVIVEYIFLIQSTLLPMIVPVPQLSTILRFLHLSLLHALYCFEYKWYNEGLELDQRISKIELNWPYYTGFGLPLAILTSLPANFVMSGCLFSILFPLFLVSANQAPMHSALTTSSGSTSSLSSTSRLVRRHSPGYSQSETVCPSLRVPIFYPSVVVSNMLFMPFVKSK